MFTTPFCAFSTAVTSLVALKCLYEFWNVLRVHVWSKVMGNAVNFPSMGEYAVVTGATDGIGKAYAFELAKLGMPIVLIGRSHEKLNNVALEIESKFKVKTRSIIIDFTARPEEIYPRIQKDLSELDIGVLVNNVGMGTSYPEKFIDTPNCSQTSLDMINVNAVSALMMCRHVLPEMVRRRRGVVINISSASAFSGMTFPLMSVYAATKAFVDYFTRCIAFETDSANVIVQSVLPFYVATKMSKIRRATFFAPNPETYVRAALRTVGREKRTYGCLSHALQALFLSAMLFLLPDSLIQKQTFDQLNAVRKKALRKQKETEAVAAKTD